MAAALVLCLFALVLSSTEAWAKEQPSQTLLQQGTVESTTIINGKVAEQPVPGATPQPVVPPPVEKPPAEDPAPLPPTNETPAAEEPSPPPIDPVPSTPKPEVAAPQPAPRPAPQWFTSTTDGEVVESAPVLTSSQSVTDFGQVLEPKPMPNDSPDVTPGVIDPAPASAAPAAGADDRYASRPAPDPVLPVPGPEAASELAGLVRGLVAEPAAPWRDGDSPRTPANPTASAVGAVQNTAASVASATAEALGTLTSSLTEPSAAGTQEDQPSEGTPQPAPPLAPPAGGGGSFSPFAGGGGQLGTGWGSAPLLVGILALLATSLLSRRDFRTYLISCEMPKPSSALLGPLERPG